MECERCGKPIKVMIFRNSGFCSRACKMNKVYPVSKVEREKSNGE